MDQQKISAAGAVDLGRRDLPPEIAADLLAETEVKMGLRCSGCRERFTHGFALLQTQALLLQGEPVAGGREVYVCGKCEASVALIEGSVASREVKQVFLDEGAAAQVLGREPA